MSETRMETDSLGEVRSRVASRFFDEPLEKARRAGRDLLSASAR